MAFFSFNSMYVPLRVASSVGLRPCGRRNSPQHSANLHTSLQGCPDCRGSAVVSRTSVVAAVGVTHTTAPIGDTPWAGRGGPAPHPPRRPRAALSLGHRRQACHIRGSTKTDTKILF